MLRRINQEFSHGLEQQDGLIFRDLEIMAVRHTDRHSQLMPLHILSQPFQSGRQRKSARISPGPDNQSLRTTSGAAVSFFMAPPTRHNSVESIGVWPEEGGEYIRGVTI